MEALPFAAQAPVSVSTIGLKARDAGALAEYYKGVVGLAEISRHTGTIVLGAGGRPLLEIENFSAAKPDDPHVAGLFHTAFLLPSRLDLARWMRRAIDRRIAVGGASDHLVSEAVYLTDPEGNGIEIYADRPQDVWEFDGQALRMATLQLDMKSLLGELGPDDTGWAGAPDASVIGHVHLRVGDAQTAEHWWNETMGFDTMAKYGKAAVFLATGGYHHHVGANAWQSAGATRRDPDRSGLSFVVLASKLATQSSEAIDPWGTAVRITPSPAHA